MVLTLVEIFPTLVHFTGPEIGRSQAKWRSMWGRDHSGIPNGSNAGVDQFRVQIFTSSPDPSCIWRPNAQPKHSGILWQYKYIIDVFLIMTVLTLAKFIRSSCNRHCDFVEYL